MCVLLLSGTCYVPDYVLQATPIEESQLLNVDGIINSTGVIVQWKLSKMITVFDSHLSKTASLPGPK